MFTRGMRHRTPIFTPTNLPLLSSLSKEVRDILKISAASFISHTTPSSRACTRLLVVVVMGHLSAKITTQVHLVKT